MHGILQNPGHPKYSKCTDTRPEASVRGYIANSGFSLNSKRQDKKDRPSIICRKIWFRFPLSQSELSALQKYSRDSTLKAVQFQIVQKDIRKKDIWRVLLLGFLFSNIFMSKQNYYVMAIYSFAMLLTELLYAKGEERRKRLTGCLWIAGAALLFLGIRYIPEFIHYGIHKQQVIVELQNEIAIPKLRPSSPPEYIPRAPRK